MANPISGRKSIPAGGHPADRDEGYLLRCDRLRLRPVRPNLGVPRAGEATAADLVAREDVVIDRPLGARHLVKHLDTVAVGIARIDAERDAMIGNMLDRPAFGFDAAVKILQIVERLEPPCTPPTPGGTHRCAIRASLRTTPSNARRCGHKC